MNVRSLFLCRSLGCALLGMAGLVAALPAWAALPITQWTHASGARIFLISSMAIPRVDVQLDFDGGARRDPVGRAGLAEAMASGTALGLRASSAGPALNENALSDAWADLGASFGGSASSDRLSFSLRSLTYPDLLTQAAALAGRQLGDPAFPAALWARERDKQMASIREANTRPATRAGRAYAAAVYGTHPYGYAVTEGSLNAIQAADLRAHHARYVRPCNARISVVGALDQAQTDALVSRLLSRLPSEACPALPAVPEVVALHEAKAIDLPFDSAQSHVLIGQPGIARSNPDYFALLVGNHILGGGGFASRLTEEVREKRGLTYSIGSYFSPGLHAGAFTISLQTRPDQAAQAVALVREVLRNYWLQGPTEAELEAAKSNLNGGFALRLDSNRKLLDNLSNIAWNDLPLDYLDTWTAHIAQLTTQDIQRAMAKALNPDAMVTVVLGSAPPAHGP